MSGYHAPDHRGDDSRASLNSHSRENPTTSYSSSQLPHYHQQSASPASIHQSHHYSQHAAANLSQTLDPQRSAHSRYAPPPRGQVSEVGQARPDEVFHLPENANLAIPEDVRNHFHQDEHGHVLFFTAPPVDTLSPVKPGSAVSHSAKYLAAKLRAQIVAKKKRKLPDSSPKDTEDASSFVTKRVKNEQSTSELTEEIQETQVEALNLLIKQMQNGTDRIYRNLYGAHWEEGRRYKGEILAARQAEAKQRDEDLEQSKRQRTVRRERVLTTSKGFKDDWDPRY